MILERLPWAGIRLEAGISSLLIDPLQYDHESLFGQAREPFYPLREFGPADAVLVTHLHSDHFDYRGIAEHFGADIPVYVPQEALDKARAVSGLTNLHGVKRHQRVTIGSFTVTATWAVDGIGDEQTAWVVEADGKRVIHSGDTLWHGYWWKIAHTFGAFDVACLPINAPVIAEAGSIASDQPIALSPEQAVMAAILLGARQLVPIHYGAFHNPPAYVQTADPLPRLEHSAKGRLALRILASKEKMTI